MKLRRKLLAAGFAFGATALTLTTSTFAWYTSNTEVTTGDVSGATSTETDSNSFYIAAAQSYDAENGYKVSTVGSYKNSATPVYTGVSVATNKVLEPVSFVDAASATMKYLPMTSASGASVSYGAYSPEKVYEWVYRFRAGTAGEAKPLYFKNFDFAVTSGSTISALAYGGNTGVDGVGDYYVDMAKAAKLTITQTPMTSETEVPSTGSSTATYSLAAWATASDQNLTVTSVNNAIGYYNTVLGTSISRPTTYDGAVAVAKTGTAIPFATIPADSGYVEVRFTIWLDGWSDYCYDVCRNQSFVLSFDVTSSAEDTNANFCTAS